MSDPDRPRRVNGLSSPYTMPQLSTWVFLPALMIEFLLFASPLLPLAASIPCSVVFCLLALSSAYYGYLAMKTDPSDPRLFSSETGEQQCTWDPNEPTKQCWLCDVQVGEKSMHCKFCNKCVDQFDHHCMCTYPIVYSYYLLLYYNVCECECSP